MQCAECLVVKGGARRAKLPKIIPCKGAAQADLKRTFCWRHSLQARFTALLRRADEGRVSASPFSCSSSVEAERLKPRVLVGLVGDMANGCCEEDAMPCVGLMD